jgi:hypothetical protein
MLIAGIGSVHFFNTPSQVRFANLILAPGILLIVIGILPLREKIAARLKSPDAGKSLMVDLGAWLNGCMETMELRTRAWHVVAVLTGLLLFSLVGSRGGILDGELNQYIPHYLSNASFLAKTFDSTKVEVDPNIGTAGNSTSQDLIWHGRPVHLIPLQRPRPLSYFVDCLDAEVIAWSVSKGVPHLLSFSFVIFLFLNYWFVWMFCRRYLGFDLFTTGLLLCLLSTDPVLSCNFSYFRSAKPGTSTFLLAGCLTAIALVARRTPLTAGRRTLLLIVTPLLLLTSCLFDEQGVLMTGVITIALFLEWRFGSGVTDQFTVKSLLWATVAALGVFGVYAVVVHPRLCMYFADLPPINMSYQTGAVRGLILEFFPRIWQSLHLLVDQFRYLTGAQIELPAILLMPWMAGSLASETARLASLGQPAREQLRRSILLHLAVMASLVVLILAALISRNEFLVRYDMRRWLYSEPSTMLLMVFLMLVVAAFLRSKRFSRPLVQLVLLGMLIGNLWMLPEHRRFLRSGYWITRLDLSLDFIDALKPGGSPTPEVADSAAYQALRAYVPKK